MPIDHTALVEPVSIRRVVTGATAADAAVVVTPPPWAISVDLRAASGDVRVATDGTEGSALTNYLTIPSGQAYNLPLQADLQTRAAVPYLVSTPNTAHVVEFAYVPRGL